MLLKKNLFKKRYCFDVKAAGFFVFDLYLYKPGNSLTFVGRNVQAYFAAPLFSYTYIIEKAFSASIVFLFL